VAAYRYLHLTLGRVPTPHQALSGRLRSLAAGELVGQFQPQLGWRNNEAAVLLRLGADTPAWNEPAPPLVAEIAEWRLASTLRPAEGDRPAPGGVYVHRWFEVERKDRDEFVRLSGEGWRGFEGRFDARIFGLFDAEAAGDESEPNIARLLLITRYRDHGEWEASRDPTTEAMQIFARRQRLTRRTWAASSLLLAA